jgi:hypothetical protein
MSTPQAHSSESAESQSAVLSVAGLRTLLGEFERKFGSKVAVPNQFKQNRALLSEFQAIRRAWEKRQVYEAEGFNVLRTMRLTTKELCHSDVLAWLLDHRLDGFGTHAQGNCGFRFFLKALGLPLEFAKHDYRVAREVSGKDSRLDIVIEAEGKFVIGVENKVTSHEILGFEGERDQTEREWADLLRRSENLHVPRGGIKAFFLTPDIESPRSSNFTSVSWRQMADVFEAFAVHAKPPMVRLFAHDYAEALSQDVAAGAQTQEEEND